MGADDQNRSMDEFDILILELLFWNGFRALHKIKRLRATIKNNAALLAYKNYFDSLNNAELNKYQSLTFLLVLGQLAGLIGVFAASGGGKVFFGLILLGCFSANVAIAPKANNLRRQLLFDGAAADFNMFHHLVKNKWLTFNTPDIPRAPVAEFVACERMGHVHHISEPYCPCCRIIDLAIAASKK